MKGILNVAWLALAAVGVSGRFLTTSGAPANAVRDAFSSHGGPGDYPHLAKRDPQAICRLGIFKALQKRGILLDLDAADNGTLTRREMTLPGEGETIEKYVLRETDDEDHPTMRRLHLQNADTGFDVNTALFRPFEQEAFGLSLVGLVGCTGMVIVSQRGVYIAHYWENIGFNQDETTPGKRYVTQDMAFRQTIQRGLQQGIHRKDQAAEQDSLATYANAIDDETIHGFLMIPRSGPSDVGEGPEDPYRQYWERMKAIVHGILPRLDPNDNTRWTEYRYKPRQAEEVQNPGTDQEWDPLERTSRGRILFKFDPNHNGKKKTLLILEDKIQEPGSREWD